MPDWTHEENTQGVVCGIDEVGRGPWAGPVVAAAVILDRRRLPATLAAAINDSKALRKAQRQMIAAELPAYAIIGLGAADVAEIGTLNIYWASMLAMQRAVAALAICPDTALVDGNRTPELPCSARAIVGGDARSLSIAAASIVAKVTRDRQMIEAAGQFPGYGFERHVGYGTAEHRAALLRLGPCALHRLGFPSLRALLAQPSLPFVEMVAAGADAPAAHDA